MTETMTDRHLEVPGARLHYEVRGSGPVLAVIGLPMTADWFQPMVDQLVDQYTVVTYDPRGFGRSGIDDPEQDATPELTADDISRVLAAVTDEPAYVFGSSGGAVTSLALVEAYPEQVAAVVAHEPPVLELLEDADEQRALARDVYDTVSTEGMGAAFGKFLQLVDPDAPPPDPATAAEQEPPPEQAMADAARMLRHSMLPTTGYQPDLDALRSGPTRVVVAGGVGSGRRAVARRAADALAAALGEPIAEFPGDHGGFLPPHLGGDPVAFAHTLRRVLA